MNDYDYLTRHRAVWEQKPVLRRIYREQFYSVLLEQCAPGERSLEIGSGPGLLGTIAPQVIRTDILPSPWIHCALDVHHLPFADGTFDNVLGLDVLHHFNAPVAALHEISRVLRPGGRLVLIEPWITPFSRLVYTYLHQEDCDLSARPWQPDFKMSDTTKQAFDGNAAIPYLLITRGQLSIPGLQLRTLKRFSFVTYLLSFGFKPVSLLPSWLYPVLYRVEKATQRAWEPLAALRALIVWERTAR